MRTVTFSDPKVAKLVHENFVPAWHNRGEGFHNEDFSRETWMYANVMEAYPTKNICTFFLTPEGRVFHYLAGSYAPAMLFKQLNHAVELRRAAFDDAMALKDGGLVALRRINARAADDRAIPREDVPDYRGAKHAHTDACAKAELDGLAYFIKLHRHWSEAKELPLLEAVQYKYVYGNSFTEEPRRGAKGVE